jgi:DNA excision repair protein ERCC-6
MTSSPPPDAEVADMAQTVTSSNAADQTTVSVKNASSPAAGSDADINMHTDETFALANLTENVRDQDDLERDITNRANAALIEAEDARDEKRIEKAETTKSRLAGQRRLQQQKLQNSHLVTTRAKIQAEIARIDSELEICEKDIADFRQRIEQRHQTTDEQEAGAGAGNKRLPNETQREFLIRTGKITPFAKIGGPRPDDVRGDLADVIRDAEDEAVAEELENGEDYGPMSHQNLRLPGFAEEAEEVEPVETVVESEFSLRPRKRRRVQTAAASDDDYEPDRPADNRTSPDLGMTVTEEDSEDYDLTERTAEKSTRKKKVSSSDRVDFSNIDDGDESVFQHRLADWVERRSRARQRQRDRDGEQRERSPDGEEEWLKPAPDAADQVLENGLKIPGDIYPALFDYQKTGVQWLAELYAQQVGGIVGDEMGLGKTVQIISFIAALHHSGKLDKPVIVVAPATVLLQWVNEFHRWWPPLRVSILHSSGSGMVNIGRENSLEEEQYMWNQQRKGESKSTKVARKIVNRVVQHGHVLVTTYAGLQTYGNILIPVDWGYAVLDEGHKIRNPNTAITIYCKELRTANRVILSGTPMQNNLTELWSLFDFIYPMRLGTLINFRNQFEIPIKLGGYANATNLQIMTAQKCAETLKDTISPYLLQRLKVDVAADLPKKSEQVLFCKLTKQQRSAYEAFLSSEEMDSILHKQRQSLYGIDILRKICNHPDLLQPKLKNDPTYQWGLANKSGKMQVIKALLHMWKRAGHKTLLFSQGVQMLDILEGFVQRQPGLQYLRMDGKTPVKERQMLVDRFNKEPNLDLFLLTTKVGGLGVNLTGANRVIIFDPDWNPSTDVQARERSWRLGQKREVTIYRLMTAGTIEEKIYHRQIFKQFLSNKVLKDPKQRTTFHHSDLQDLFTLSTYGQGATETGELFKGTEAKLNTPRGPARVVGPGSDPRPFLPRPGAEPAKAAAADDEKDDEGELREIAGVAALEAYKGEEGDAPVNEEDRLMEGIFARSVHSALEHDEIVNGKKPIQADRKILQQEANRVAATAAAHLRRSREEAQHVPIGTVTWTGEYGAAGRPSNVRRGRGGPSSAGILAGIADRQGLTTANGNSSAGSSRATTPSAADRNMKAEDFVRMIPAFIKRHGGQVPSKLLVDHFNRYCESPRQAGEFKAALDKVARMEKKGSSMRAIWALKPAYQ